MATCVVTGTIYNSSEEPLDSILVYAIPAMSPSISSTGFAIAPIPIQTVTSSTGIFELPLMQGVEFIVTIPSLGFREKIVVPDLATYDLFNMGSVPIGDNIPTPPGDNPNW